MSDEKVGQVLDRILGDESGPRSITVDFSMDLQPRLHSSLGHLTLSEFIAQSHVEQNVEEALSFG
ncbi:MAG: hypothetical protein H8K03_04765 [Nitrospira sp.]